jgi:protein-tyrosine kinase
MKRFNHRSDIEDHLAVPLLVSSSGNTIIDPPLFPVEDGSETSLSDAEGTPKDSLVNPLMVTSTFPAEGKSTFAASYGIALAKNGYQVLLVDGDFYRPTLHKKLNIPNSFGIGDLRCESMECLVDAIQETSIPRLFVLPVGTVSTYPSDLYASTTIPQALDQLKDQFDIVLVDAPPILVMEAGAVVLTTYVNNIVFVVRKGKTTFDDCAKAMERLRLVRATVRGAVLTDFKEDRQGKARDDVLSDAEKHGEGFSNGLSFNPCSEIDLHNANLYKADLQGADLSYANLREAFLFRSVLNEACLCHADLQGANLAATDFQGANLGVADLQRAVLFQANLREANLALAKLNGANLFGADLREANLSYAYLQGADFSGADLEGAILNRAKLDHDTCLPDGTQWTPETDLAQFTRTNGSGLAPN